MFLHLTYCAVLPQLPLTINTPRPSHLTPLTDRINMAQVKPPKKLDQMPNSLVERTSTNESEEIGEVRSKVHFGLLSAIGVQYSVTGAPIAIGTYLSLTIGLGGSPAYFWGFVVMGFFQLTTCLAISELASAIPHSSGKRSKRWYWLMVVNFPRTCVLGNCLKHPLATVEH